MCRLGPDLGAKDANWREDYQGQAHSNGPLSSHFLAEKMTYESSGLAGLVFKVRVWATLLHGQDPIVAI